jgi:hypothetical protein
MSADDFTVRTVQRSHLVLRQYPQDSWCGRTTRAQGHQAHLQRPTFCRPSCLRRRRSPPPAGRPRPPAGRPRPPAGRGRGSGEDAATRGSPVACRGIASRPRGGRGWQRGGPRQRRRGQGCQGMNKRVSACNDLKLKPRLVQSMQRFQKRTKIGRRPGPPARGPAQMQTVY